jgi:hypothetical protein
MRWGSRTSPVDGNVYAFEIAGGQNFGEGQKLLS